MHELLLRVIFYAFAALMVLASFFAVIQRNPVRAVLSLVAAFLSAAVLWMLAQAEFLALILVLVYVGAVMTLFLFVVMMLNIDTESVKSNIKQYLPWMLVGLVLFVVLLKQAIPNERIALGEAVNLNKTVLSNTKSLGMVLYVDYVLALEMAAMILLVAIIAAITLTHRTRRIGHRQDIVKQIMTRREERITLVSMPAEKSDSASNNGASAS